MKLKLLVMLAWIFFYAARSTRDDLWLFCLGVCTVMGLCAFFYGLENKSKKI